ncbi:MAG: FKBP-type peptidyl-prolyl cis-trans isomerase [Chlorobia bacterium]|nr:FKBP-type peptidyl-prolyl cis-trans isomerase [Fimbriimonadaceae bacterium]
MKGQAFIAIFALSALIIGCSKPDSGSGGPANGGATSGTTTPVAALKDLKIEDIEPGKGEGAKEGDTLAMLYRGQLVDGSVFDGNMDGEFKAMPDKDPFSLNLGMGMVIPGWDKGLIGIKVGGLRKLSIPASMAYGPQAQAKIPANSDLIFNVRCLDIVRRGEESVIDIKDTKAGTGAEVKKGDKVTIHYVGKLLNDKEFDSSRKANKPFSFTVGAGEVVPGFDKGVIGMRKGGVRMLRIPPGAAYGANPAGAIPPNSVLKFEMELLQINGK